MPKNLAALRWLVKQQQYNLAIFSDRWPETVDVHKYYVNKGLNRYLQPISMKPQNLYPEALYKDTIRQGQIV